MNNTVKLSLGTSSEMLIGIGTVFLVTLYSQVVGILTGLVLVIAGTSGLVATKWFSKPLYYVSVASQVLIGASVFGLTAVTKPHVFNLSWSLIVVLLALLSIILNRKHGRA